MDMRQTLSEIFESVHIEAVTVRHFSLLAIKEGEKDNETKKPSPIQDNRFLSDRSYCLEDTYLNLWETKEDPVNT